MSLSIFYHSSLSAESQVIVDCFESMLDLLKNSEIKEQTAFLQKQYFRLCDAAFTGGLPFDEDETLAVSVGDQGDDSAGKQSALDTSEGQPGTSREQEACQPGEATQDGPPSKGKKKGVWRGSSTGTKEARMLNPLGIPLELLQLCQRHGAKRKSGNQADNGGQDDDYSDDDGDDDDDEDGFYRENPSGDAKVPEVEHDANDVGGDHHVDDNRDGLADGEKGTSGAVLADHFQQNDENKHQSSPAVPGFQQHTRPSSSLDVHNQSHGVLSHSDNPSSPSKAHMTDSSDDEDILMSVKQKYPLYTRKAPSTYKGRRGQNQAVSNLLPEELLFGAPLTEVKKESTTSPYSIRINRPVPAPLLNLKSDDHTSDEDMNTCVDSSQTSYSPVQSPAPFVSMDDVKSEGEVSHAGNQLLRIDLSRLDPDSNIVIPASVLPGGILTIQSPGMSEEGNLVIPTTKEQQHGTPSSMMFLPSHYKYHKGSAVSGMEENQESASRLVMTGQDQHGPSQEKELIILPQTDVRIDEADVTSDGESINALESSFEEENADQPTEIQLDEEIQEHRNQADLPTVIKRRSSRYTPSKGQHTEDTDVLSRTGGTGKQSEQSKPKVIEKESIPSTVIELPEERKQGHSKQSNDAVATEQIPKDPRDTPKRRGRGRPPKIKQENDSSIENNAQPKGKRGRPPKQKNSEQLPEKGTVLQSSSDPVQSSAGKHDAVGTDQLQKEPRHIPQKRGRGRPRKVTGQKAPTQPQVVTEYSEASNTMQGGLKELASKNNAEMQILLLSQALEAIAQIGKNLNASLNDLSSSFGRKVYVAPSGMTENPGVSHVIESMTHLKKSFDSGLSELNDESQNEKQPEKLHDPLILDGDSKDKHEKTHISSNGDVDVENVEQSRLHQATSAWEDSETIQRSSQRKQEPSARNASGQVEDFNREMRQTREVSDMGNASSKASSGKSPKKSPAIRTSDHDSVRESNVRVAVKQETIHTDEDFTEQHSIAEGDPETQKEDKTSKQREKRKSPASTEVCHRANKRRRAHPSESVTSGLSVGRKSIPEQSQSMTCSESSEVGHELEKSKREHLAEIVECISSRSQSPGNGITEGGVDGCKQSSSVSPGQTNQEGEVNAPPTITRKNGLRSSYQEETGHISNTSGHETLLACFNQEVRSPKTAVVFSLKKR